MMKKLSLVVTFMAVCFIGPAFGQTCDLRNLPQQVQVSVRAAAPEWHVLTREMLDSDDRQEWDSDYHGCPGVVKGSFIAGKDAYAISLVKEESGSKFQQSMVVSLDSTGAHNYVLTPPTKVPVWSVISKEPAGRYRDIRNGKHVVTRAESPALIRLDVGEALFFWNGGRFERIITSN